MAGRRAPRVGLANEVGALVWNELMSADLAAAKRFYGAVVSPPADTPYGRIAVVSDDHGAVFSLIEDTSG